MVSWYNPRAVNSDQPNGGCNDDHDQPVDEWIAFQDAVTAEDKAMVESQQPQDLPLDLTAEMHIEADAWSIAYRRRWKLLEAE